MTSITAKTFALVLALALILLTACLTLFQTKTYLPYMNLLNQSIEYDMNRGKLSLTIPEGLPAEYSFYILIAGRVKTGETAMSIHLFDDESANSSWVAGKTYSHLFQNDSFLSATILTAIKMNQTGEILAETERTTDIFIDGNGELSISVHVQIPAQESTSESAPSVAFEKIAQKSTPQPQSIAFFGETYLLSEADTTIQDESGNIVFAQYEDRGFVCLSYETAPMYQHIKPGQQINGMTVAEGTHMGFDLINGKWELTESDVMLTGPIALTGELTLTPEDGIYPAGTLVFTPSDSARNLLPFHYGDSTGPEFIFREDTSKIVPPAFFANANTVAAKVTLDNLRLLQTERMTGGKYATLLKVEEDFSAYEKYLNPIGNYLTLRDSWRTEDFAKQFPVLIFDTLCYTQDTGYISGDSPYLKADEGWVFNFPAELVENFMQKFFDISPGDLRRVDSFDAIEITYRVEAPQMGGAYPDVEIWDVEKKDDGTLAINVAFVGGGEDNNAYNELAAILTVKPTADGGFKYISNESLGV